jgi:hypothetical protein
MRHRIALVIGSLASAGTLAVALSAAGLGPADPSLASSVATAPPSTPRLQVDTVYVPAPAQPQTITVHRVVATSGEGEDGEGGGDD